MAHPVNSILGSDVVVLNTSRRMLSDLGARRRAKRIAVPNSSSDSSDEEEDEHEENKEQQYISIPKDTSGVKARVVHGDTDDAASSTEASSEASFGLTNAMANLPGLSRFRSARSFNSIDDCLNTAGGSESGKNKSKRQRSSSPFSTASAPEPRKRPPIVQEPSGYVSDEGACDTPAVQARLVRGPRFKLKPVTWC